MSYLYYSIAAFLLYLTQHTLLVNWTWHGCIPDLMVLLLLIHAERHQMSNQAYLGISIGLVVDLMSGRWLGTHILLYFLVGLGIEVMKRIVFMDRALVRCANVFILSMLVQWLGFMMLGLFGWRVLLELMMTRIFFTGLYSLLLMMVVMLFQWIVRHFWAYVHPTNTE